MLPEFELWLPQTLPEALQQLSAAGAQATPVAGGTNIAPDLRSGRRCPKVLIDISKLVELHGIRSEAGRLSAGGGTTLAALLASPLVVDAAAPLHQAAALFANRQVRNRATLAGNLADASPAADTAPPLLALDAEVELISQSGRRTVPLDGFFTGVRQTVCRPDELIYAVHWPMPEPEAIFGYYKLGLRKADAISVISVATRVDRGPGGQCREARIALGSVAPCPLRAHEAENILRGQALTEAKITEAACAAARTASPITDLRSSASYRRRMVERLVRRQLQQASAAFRNVE